MDSGSWPSVVAWVVFGVSLALAGWLYLAPPTIHLEYRGPEVTCSALGTDPFGSGNMLLGFDAYEAVKHLMESRGVADGPASLEEKRLVYAQMELETVAACQDARLNRQTALMVVLATGLAAFGVAFSRRRSRVDGALTAETQNEGDGGGSRDE